MSSVVVFNGFFQKKIRSSEIPGEPDFNAIQPTIHKISHFSSHFFKMSSVSHLVFNIFFPKGIQIIINTNRATTSNLNVIQLMVYKMSNPQAIRMAILFSMDSSQKLIRSSEIPRNHNFKLECDPTKGSSDIAPTIFLGGHLFKMSSVSHLVFNVFFPKVNHIFRNILKITL